MTIYADAVIIGDVNAVAKITGGVEMRNLAAEMTRYGVTNTDLQSVLACSAKTVTNKLTDVTEFSINEAFVIRDTFFPGLRVEYLFARPEDGAKEA